MRKISGLSKIILRKFSFQLILFAIPAFAFGQLVNVNVVVTPPYSSNYSTYENLANHVIITLTGTARDMTVYLTGELISTQSDNSISTGPDYNPAGATFLLPARQTKVIINDISKMLFLNRRNVIHSGIDEQQWAQILRTDKLPEGQYRLCINVKTNSVTGSETIGRACADFSVTYAQSPVITMPQSGQELNPAQPNTIFSWTPPAGNTIGAAVAYDLYVVKVLPGQNPNDAINAALNYKANNPLIKTNLTGNQYVTQPYDLKIDSNTLYAVQVIAHDLNKKVGFLNNGRSEVITFTKGKLKSDKIISMIAPVEKNAVPKSSSPGYSFSNIDPVPFSQIKGKLYYRFKDAGKESSGAKRANLQKPETVQTNVMGLNSAVTGDVNYNKENTPLMDAKPLAGKTISLILTYLFSGTDSRRENSYQGEPIPKGYLTESMQQQNEKVLATTTTSGDGSFTFNFANIEKDMGIADKNFSIHSGGEFHYDVKGVVYKVLRVRVEDKYYCSPDVNIKVDPWKGIDLGTMVSFVKSYSLKIKVVTTNSSFWDMAQGQGSPVTEVETSIFRKGAPPSSVPQNEGESLPGILTGQDGEKVRGTHISGADGYVTFLHLVQHNPDNKTDKYFIKCVPDKKAGNFFFKKTEKSYYPLNEKDLFNFPFNGTRQSTPSKNQSGTLEIPMPYGEDITWNHELTVRTYIDSIHLYPAQPRIAGKIQVSENVEAKELVGKKILMINNYAGVSDPSKFLTVVKTNSEGRYEFNELPVEMDTFNTKGVTSVIGPTRTMLVKVDGFKMAQLPGKKASDSLWKSADNKGIENKCDGCYPPLKWGQQLLNQDFFLTPDGYLSGYVEDENGKPVKADIDVDGFIRVTTEGAFVTDNTPASGGQKLQNKNAKQSVAPVNYSIGLNSAKQMKFQERFTMHAPSGKRKITIIPTDKTYAAKDTSFSISTVETSPLKFIVLRKQKRIRFKVAEAPPGSKPGKIQLPAQGIKGISGAKVKLNIPSNPIIQTTDQEGYVTFIFDNSARDFEFIITPPENSDFEECSYTISGVEDLLQTKTYGTAFLKKAVTITGIVTIGPDKKPLEGAVVYIEFGSKNLESEPTGKNGKYILKRVPASPVEKTVWAGKAGAVPNIISQSKKISVAINQDNSLDFNLIDDNELAISKLFGFEVEIKGKKEKQPDDTWLINGNLRITGNDNFTPEDNKQTVIPFHNLKIKKSGKEIGGVPEGVPADNFINTDLASLKLLFQKFFTVVQYPVSGDQLQIRGDNQNGSLTGKVAIQKSSFGFSKDNLKLNDNSDDAMLLTEKPGSSNMDISTIESRPVTRKKFGVTGMDGKPPEFKLLGFDASAEPDSSWIQDNSINLQTVIHIRSLPGMNPSTVDIRAGNLLIHTGGLEPLKGNKPIQFKLEKWQFTGNDWQLAQNNSSIVIASGVMHTGSMDIPLKNISLKPDHLAIGSYEVNNLSLSGIIPVKVNTENPAFGYNKSTGKDQGPHYELRLIGQNGQPGVTIGNLPGMKTNDAFRFQNFSIISNGDQILNPGNQTNDITLYSVMKVRPLAFSGETGYVNMDCGIDLGIPQVQETSGAIQFRKEAGKIKLFLFPLNVSLQGPGGVNFTPNVQFNDQPQQLSEGNFTAMGTIRDQEGIVLKGKLHRTTQTAWIQVEPENQKLQLGGNGTSFANITGKMEADMTSGTWKNFVFSGDMQGFMGMEGNTKKTFTVTGSINATNQQIDVKNIPSAFGNIGLTYDIANSRFLGNLQLDKNFAGLTLKGNAELLVDPGGWYFLAGGEVAVPGFGGLSSGLLIGDYNSMPANVSSVLMQYAYDKNVPASFKNGISGFFFTGMKTLPFSIPNFSIDLGVISAAFGADAGLDARLWMGFNNSANEYGIGAMAFAHAYLKGASITCTKFSADARAELGVKGVYSTSNGAFTLNGCGSFTISGSIRQCFPTPCLSDGICCEGCIGIGASKGIRVDVLLDSKGNSDFSFGFGNCSGKTPMTGNW